jgi:hypothetical protein
VTDDPIVPANASEAERQDARSLIENSAERFDRTGPDSIATDVLEGDDVVERLLAESEDYDVAIIGATREGQLQQFVFGAIPEEFTRRAPVTTIVTKRNVGLTSRLVRLVGQGMPDYRSTEPRTQESSGERRVRMGRGFPSDAENRRGDVAAWSAAEIPVAFHLAMVMVERCT